MSNSSGGKPEVSLILHATSGDVPVSPTMLLGPFFLAVVLQTTMIGGVLAIFGLYLHKFGGRKGDRWYLQIAMSLCVALHLTHAIKACIDYFSRTVLRMFSAKGLDIAIISSDILVGNIIQGVSIIVGQTYFLFRTAKLCEPGFRKWFAPVMMSTFVMQLILIVWYAAEFYTARSWTRLVVERWKDQRIKHILGVWTGFFIFNELSLTCTLITRLLMLRKHCSSDTARKIMYDLGVYSLQGHVVIVILSLTTLSLFRADLVGFYTPVYLTIGPIYTVIVFANLIHRDTVQRRMIARRPSQSSGSGGSASHKASRAGGSAGHIGASPSTRRGSVSIITRSRDQREAGRYAEGQHSVTQTDTLAGTVTVCSPNRRGDLGVLEETVQYATGASEDTIWKQKHEWTPLQELKTLRSPLSPKSIGDLAQPNDLHPAADGVLKKATQEESSRLRQNSSGVANSSNQRPYPLF